MILSFMFSFVLLLNLNDFFTFQIWFKHFLSKPKFLTKFDPLFCVHRHALFISKLTSCSVVVCIISSYCFLFFQHCKKVINGVGWLNDRDSPSPILCGTRVYQGCGVGGKTSDSDLSKISDSDSSTWREWNFDVKINGSRGAQQEICSNKSFKRIYTISAGIPNLGMWRKNDPIGHPDSEKKSDSDSQCCYESGSTQKPPTPRPWCLHHSFILPLCFTYSDFHWQLVPCCAMAITVSFLFNNWVIWKKLTK